MKDKGYLLWTETVGPLQYVDTQLCWSFKGYQNPKGLVKNYLANCGNFFCDIQGWKLALTHRPSQNQIGECF